jgi:predicted Zn-dependent protease
VKIIVDEELTKRWKNWQRKIKEIIAEVSSQFKKQVGVELKIKEIQKWKHSEEFQKKLGEGWKRLILFDIIEKEIHSSLPTNKKEILIAISGLKEVLTHADQEKGYVIMSSEFEKCYRESFKGEIPKYIEETFKTFSQTLMHEICHLFGAEHANGNSVMGLKATFEIDRENKRVILLNKYRYKFKR